MTTTPPQDQPAPQEGFGIDPRLGADNLRAPAASKEDSHPKATITLGWITEPTTDSQWRCFITSEAICNSTWDKTLGNSCE